MINNFSASSKYKMNSAVVRSKSFMYYTSGAYNSVITKQAET